jgi:hypothetical protein
VRCSCRYVCISVCVHVCACLCASELIGAEIHVNAGDQGGQAGRGSAARGGGRARGAFALN